VRGGGPASGRTPRGRRLPYARSEWGCSAVEHTRFVIVRISACGEVSLREGDAGGDAVSLTARDAIPLLEAINAAFARASFPGPGRWSAGLVAHCVACYGSLAAGQPPTSPGGTCGFPCTRPPLRLPGARPATHPEGRDE
jgi:hypothetical protein